MQLDGANWTLMEQLPPSQRAAAADIDHDGDLDLLLMDTEQHYLLANDGQAGFDDVTASSTMADVPPIRRVVFSDFDDDRDVDFFALSDAAVHLYSNNRDGTEPPRPGTASPRKILGRLQLIVCNLQMRKLANESSGFLRYKSVPLER